MHSKIKYLPILIGIFFVFAFTLPVIGHGDDPEEEPAAQVEDSQDDGDGHSDDGDHSDEDGHQESSGNLQFVIGGIIGALLLAGGAVFLFSPRPPTMVLAGLALIGATGVIHLMVGAFWGDTILLLNGIGYLVLGVVWGMPNEMFSNQKKIVAGILAVYTLITIGGYFATHDHYDFVAILTKAIEGLLLIILGLAVFRPDVEG